ncbi:hypothetical protein GW7_11108 [Heterocephalus glaber]|uniref:Uncharacterized protein n=1 Tax=Heterocephalus glaber TaxID=10181 RepID=G5BD62_HETGA|nr:hypothetical protein GW7_11108 [Heterocephalus glaber]
MLLLSTIWQKRKLTLTFEALSTSAARELLSFPGKGTAALDCQRSVDRTGPDRTAALALILVPGLSAFMIVNSLCKIFGPKPTLRGANGPGSLPTYSFCPSLSSLLGLGTLKRGPDVDAGIPTLPPLSSKAQTLPPSTYVG